MENMLNDLKNKYQIHLTRKSISLDGLAEAISFYTRVSEKFHQRLAKIDNTQ